MLAQHGSGSGFADEAEGRRSPAAIPAALPLSLPGQPRAGSRPAAPLGWLGPVSPRRVTGAVLPQCPSDEGTNAWTPLVAAVAEPGVGLTSCAALGAAGVAPKQSNFPPPSAGSAANSGEESLKQGRDIPASILCFHTSLHLLIILPKGLL